MRFDSVFFADQTWLFFGKEKEKKLLSDYVTILPVFCRFSVRI